MNQPRKSDGTFGSVGRDEKPVELPSVSESVRGFVPPVVLENIKKNTTTKTVSESLEVDDD